MSLQDKLQRETAGHQYVDTDAIVEQGKRAFMFMIEPKNNPFKSDRDRKLWNIGYEHARSQWMMTQKKEKPMR